MESTQVEVGPGGVPKDAKTSDYYRVKDIPNRFDHPDVSQSSPGNPVFTCTSEIMEDTIKRGDWFQGYKSKEQHPMYRTTNREYGAREPSVHTMPTVFHAKSQKFSGDLGKCGMYRNHSLNCALDKSCVPDH